MRRRFLRILLYLLFAPVFIVIMYLFAAFAGGIMPHQSVRGEAGEQPFQQPVFLVSNALHADIAIPVNSLVLRRFSFLAEAGIPFQNPDMKYLIFGWGSKRFYTSTREYSDIEFATAWQAVTGDDAVMHVQPAGELKEGEGVLKLKISQEGFIRLVEFIAQSFTYKELEPQLLHGAGFGLGDVFYESPGRFNIFNPCNIWAARALREAGIRTGVWTPTTYSLLAGYKLYN